MSSQFVAQGIVDGARAVFQPLPEVTEQLHVVHYATDTSAEGYATPPVVAIVVQNVLSGEQMTFATITNAHAAGIGPEAFHIRFPQLEREVLSAFSNFATTHAKAVWVHWRMRDALFGFDALKLRATVHRVRHHGIPPERRFDLSHHLERRYGDQFAPRPRLWNAVRRNFGIVPGLLNRESLATAWANRNYDAVMRSLTEQVAGIARLFERARLNTFISGEGEPYNGTGTVTADKPTLIRGNPTASAGPSIWLPPEVFDPKRLTERHRAILEELFRHNAYNLASSLKTKDIARAVDGSKAKTNSFKRPIRQLCKWGCVATAEGRSGGVWLTEIGRTIADITTK